MKNKLKKKNQIEVIIPSADLSVSLHFGITLPCLRICVHMNNFSSNSTRPKDMLLLLKDSLSMENDKSDLAVCLNPRAVRSEIPPPKI